ncbi:MAG: hypothetical protein K0S76_3039 [Herbinix sp.]|jgi:hypothetical protein|nr:hypothetical protein [Herbinix sp.]
MKQISTNTQINRMIKMGEKSWTNGINRIVIYVVFHDKLVVTGKK